MKRTATKTDQDLIDILGGITFEGNTITHEQVRNFSEFYGYKIDIKKLYIEPSSPRSKKQYPRKEEDPEVLFHAGSFRNMTREIINDGIRVMAFLSKYLDKNEDPVNLVAKAFINAGYDVTDELWDEETEGEENI
jgi:hypothetical protein